MAYPDGEGPPVRGDNLKSILDAKYWTDARWKWKDKYNDVTRGDLMRLAGWVPKDSQGKEIKEVSPTLEQLDVDDFLCLGQILADHNNDHGGVMYRGIYFCCSCV